MKPLGAVLSVAVLMGGCTEALPLPQAPAAAEVVMDEFSFSAPAEVPRGRVVFRVANRGELRHELVVIALPEDVPPLDEQLRSERRRATTTVAVIPPKRPAVDTSFALDLEAGRYGLVCFLESPDGRPHALKGMNQEFRVR